MSDEIVEGAQTPPDNSGGAVTRHDAIPETYFDPKAGYKFDDIGTALTEAESLRASAAERAKDIPESPDGYEIALPADFEMPEGMRFEVDPKDPMVQGLRAFAAEHKLTKAEVNGLVALKMKADAEQIKAQNAFDAEQTKQLGANAGQRRDAAKAWIGKTLTPSQQQVMNTLLDYKDGVEAVEAIIAATNIDTRDTGNRDQRDTTNDEFAEQAGKPGGGMAMLRQANKSKN